MARNLENSTSENSNIQEVGPRRSTRLNVILGGAAPLPQGSTMGTTAVATTAITRGEVHGSTTTAQAVLSKAHATKATARAMPLHAQREPNALPIRAQASHSRASRAEQPTLVAQPAPEEQPTPVVQSAPDEQPTAVAQFAHAKQLTPVTTMGTTTVATSVATRGEVHGAFTVTQAMSLQAQREPNALPSQAQASRSSASRTEQPTHVAQLAPEQPTLAAQHALVAQPASVVFQAAQVGPRQSQPSGPTIKPGAFSPYFFTDLAFPNSNLAPGIYHPSTAQGGIFLPSSSNPNGEQHLSRQVMELTSALAQQTTLVNQLLQRTKMQRVPNEESRRRTRADEEPLQQRPGKQPLNQPRTKRSGRVHSQLGPRDSVYSRFSTRRSVHSI